MAFVDLSTGVNFKATEFFGRTVKVAPTMTNPDRERTTVAAPGKNFAFPGHSTTSSKNGEGPSAPRRCPGRKVEKSRPRRIGVFSGRGYAERILFASRFWAVRTKNLTGFGVDDHPQSSGHGCLPVDIVHYSNAEKTPGAAGRPLRPSNEKPGTRRASKQCGISRTPRTLFDEKHDALLVARFGQASAIWNAGSHF